MTFSGVNNQITELLGWEGKSKVATSQHSFLSWHSAKTYKQNHAYLCTSQKLIKTCSGNPKVLLTHRLPGISVRETCVSEIEKVNIFQSDQESQYVVVKMPTSTSLLVTKITKIYRFRPAAAVENGLKSGKYLQSWAWQSLRNRKGFVLIFISYWWFDFGLSVIWLRAWD